MNIPNYALNVHVPYMLKSIIHVDIAGDVVLMLVKQTS